MRFPRRAPFWIAVVLGIVLGQCVSGLRADDEKLPLPNRPADYKFHGCQITTVIYLGEPGWHVTVWADYEAKPEGSKHDWHKWYSFRKGKNGDDKAWKDCKEWRKKFQRAAQSQ